MSKIGILVPHSTIYPQLTMNLMDGLHLAIEAMQDENKPEIIIEDIGNGSNINVIKEKVQKLLLQYRIDMAIAYVSQHAIAPLTQIFDTHQKKLLITNFGANLNPISESSYVAFNSFELWESSYQLGIHLGSENSKIAVVGSIYDGGFHYSNGFYEGLQKKGGSIVLNHIANNQPNENSWQNLLQNLKNTEVDCLFVQLSNNFAQHFFSWYEQHSHLINLPLYVNSLALSEIVLAKWSKNIATSVHSLASWFPTLQTDENSSFINEFESEFNKKPDEFALLGYEAGLILNLLEEKRLLSKVKLFDFNEYEFDFKSPRGDRIWKEKENHWSSNQHVLGTKKSGKSSMSFSTINNDSTNQRNEFRLKEELFPLSGWLSTYQC